MNEKRDKQTEKECAYERERGRDLVILPNRLSQFISKELREIQQNIDTLNIVTHAKANTHALACTHTHTHTHSR